MGEEDKCACHTEEKARLGECCKQKPNALDEFWKSVGDKEKLNVRSYRPSKRNIQVQKDDARTARRSRSNPRKRRD